MSNYKVFILTVGNKTSIMLTYNDKSMLIDEFNSQKVAKRLCNILTRIFMDYFIFSLNITEKLEEFLDKDTVTKILIFLDKYCYKNILDN